MKNRYSMLILAVILAAPMVIGFYIAYNETAPGWEGGVHYTYDTHYMFGNGEMPQIHPAVFVASLVEFPLIMGMFMFALPKSACMPSQKCPRCNHFIKYAVIERNMGLCDCGQKLILLENN